jgi:hypothetical protein
VFCRSYILLVVQSPFLVGNFKFPITPYHLTLYASELSSIIYPVLGFANKITFSDIVTSVTKPKSDGGSATCLPSSLQDSFNYDSALR